MDSGTVDACMFYSFKYKYLSSPTTMIKAKITLSLCYLFTA